MAKHGGDQLKKPSSAKGNVTPKKYSSSSFEANIERIRVDDESDIEKIYQMGEVLGKGAFGVVKEVTHRESKERFAMKIVAKDKVKGGILWNLSNVVALGWLF